MLTVDRLFLELLTLSNCINIIYKTCGTVQLSKFYSLHCLFYSLQFRGETFFFVTAYKEAFEGSWYFCSIPTESFQNEKEVYGWAI